MLRLPPLPPLPPLPRFLTHRPVVVASLCVVLASLCVTALGSDTPFEYVPPVVAAIDPDADPKPEPVPEAKPSGGKKKSKKKGKAKAEAEAVRAAKEAEADALDLLRDRIAEKLGAPKGTDEAKYGVLRVAAAASVPAATPTPAVAPASAAATPQRPAAPATAASAPVIMVAVKPSAEPRPAPAPAPVHAAHWDYQGSGGPESWGRLKPEFAKCSTGSRQSPIDIRDGIKLQLDPVQFDYKPSAFRVIDNGHTVQVNVSGGNAIEVMGRRYELVQFHFHRPSEERINGRQFDMVAHLVHKDSEGRLAVVAVLLERGGAQPIVQTVWNNLPLEKGEELAAKATLDLNGLLPEERSYFTYMGSLTTPPCSEGVLWMVMKNPVPISAEQIGIFARLYPMNARPIQSASGRMIKESN
jgi:carbonic anhydrase